MHFSHYSSQQIQFLFTIYIGKKSLLWTPSLSDQEQDVWCLLFHSSCIFCVEQRSTAANADIVFVCQLKKKKKSHILVGSCRRNLDQGVIFFCFFSSAPLPLPPSFLPSFPFFFFIWHQSPTTCWLCRKEDTCVCVCPTVLVYTWTLVWLLNRTRKCSIWWQTSGKNKSCFLFFLY